MQNSKLLHAPYSMHLFRQREPQSREAVIWGSPVLSGSQGEGREEAVPTCVGHGEAMNMAAAAQGLLVETSPVGQGDALRPVALVVARREGAQRT